MIGPVIDGTFQMSLISSRSTIPAMRPAFFHRRPNYSHLQQASASSVRKESLTLFTSHSHVILKEVKRLPTANREAKYSAIMLLDFSPSFEATLSKTENETQIPKCNRNCLSTHRISPKVTHKWTQWWHVSLHECCVTVIGWVLHWPMKWASYSLRICCFRMFLCPLLC